MVPDLDPPRGFLADLAKVLPLAVRGRPRPRLRPAPFSRKMEDFSVALPGVPVLPGKKQRTTTGTASSQGPKTYKLVSNSALTRKDQHPPVS